METKDTAEKTAPSAAPAKPAPKPRPGEPEPEEPVPSVPLSGPEEDSLEGLGAAFSGLHVGGPEGKEKEKEKGAVDKGVVFTELEASNLQYSWSNSPQSRIKVEIIEIVEVLS